LAFHEPYVDYVTLVQNGDRFSARSSRLVHAFNVGDKNLKLMFTIGANVSGRNVRAIAVKSVVNTVVGHVSRVTKSIANTFK
jgi:hypothetical protein